MSRCPETRFRFLDIHPQAIDSATPGAPVVLQLERRGGLMYLAFTVE